MNLDELGSTFKEILLTPPEHLSYESQHKFQNLLRHTPSPTLFKLRSLLDMMQNQVSPKNYKTYSGLLRSLLDTQESLPGRISPDILEPVSDLHQLRPGNCIENHDSIEITTGTSIWALYLKRQLQENSRIDQRQLKSVYIIKFAVLYAFSRTLHSAFLNVMFWNKGKKLELHLNPLKQMLRKLFVDVVKSIKLRHKGIKDFNKRKKRRLSFLVNRLQGIRSLDITRCFQDWHSFSMLSYSYSCLSPICPEKEESEAVIRLNETLNMTCEKHEKVSKVLLSKLEDIGCRANRLSFGFIMRVAEEQEFYELLEERKRQIDKQGKVARLIDDLAKVLRVVLFHYHNKWKLVNRFQNKREKCLKTVTKFVNFRLFNVLLAFNQKVFKVKLTSCKLVKKMHNISVNHLRRHLFDILSFHESLLKKGFDMFVHNKYKKTLENISNTWKNKLKYSESKWQDKQVLNLSRFKSSTFFSTFCDNYSRSLLRHSFQSLKHCQTS